MNKDIEKELWNNFSDDDLQCVQSAFELATEDQEHYKKHGDPESDMDAEAYGTWSDNLDRMNQLYSGLARKQHERVKKDRWDKMQEIIKEPTQAGFIVVGSLAIDTKFAALGGRRFAVIGEEDMQILGREEGGETVVKFGRRSLVKPDKPYLTTGENHDI
ncbi:MAG: hypothetical protein KAJ03_00680 [Gammaproteobacteria bacterium]|nr:hypothetical protein [Gammaproteobacteria bacterium]